MLHMCMVIWHANSMEKQPLPFVQKCCHKDCTTAYLAPEGRCNGRSPALVHAWCYCCSQPSLFTHMWRNPHTSCSHCYMQSLPHFPHLFGRRPHLLCAP